MFNKKINSSVSMHQCNAFNVRHNHVISPVILGFSVGGGEDFTCVSVMM